jgi:hypothetical protein
MVELHGLVVVGFELSNLSKAYALIHWNKK